MGGQAHLHHPAPGRQSSINGDHHIDHDDKADNDENDNDKDYDKNDDDNDEENDDNDNDKEDAETNSHEADLVSISDSAELSFVDSLAGGEFWIGGLRSCLDCPDWSWSDGSDWRVSSWKAGQGTNTQEI